MIGIFTFTLTARTNLMFIQHPHLQARTLCLCPCDALFLSCGQSILERLTTENKIISSALTLKPKYYQNLEKFLKNRKKWTSWLAALYGSKLVLSTKHGLSFRLDFNLRKNKSSRPLYRYYGHVLKIFRPFTGSSGLLYTFFISYF